MGDEYQNRKDIDKIFDDLYDPSRTLNVITFSDDSKYKNISSDIDNKDIGTIDAIIKYFGLDELDNRFDSLLDIIYPIGTVYHTKDSGFDPNLYFNGLWELIEDTEYEWERISETE